MFVYYLFAGGHVYAQNEPEVSLFANSLIWTRLLHYRQVGGGYESRVVNKEFFASSDGKVDPLKELSANLINFRKILPVNENHPQCRFPARYEILKKYFDLAPPVKCAAIDRWFEEYKPQKISFVYASQFVSNPTSVFGHSFLLFSSNDVNEYLWATFNYAADIPENANAISYVVDGLGGGFNGSFEVIPFFSNVLKFITA
jgi:hypothetical protein